MRKRYSKLQVAHFRMAFGEDWYNIMARKKLAWFNQVFVCVCIASLAAFILVAVLWNPAQAQEIDYRLKYQERKVTQAEKDVEIAALETEAIRKDTDIIAKDAPE